MFFVEFQDKKEEDKPLAGLLPPEYKGVDVQNLFPEFRSGQVCSSLIGCRRGVSSSDQGRFIVF